MTPFVTMRRALSDKHLLGAALGGDSWLAWRVLLIAAMGEALTDEERAIFAKLTGREREPGERVDELWCVIGRRGGKSRAIAALLVYLATMVDYRAQLVLGERGVVLCLARTQEQSQVVLEYVAGIIEAAPILAKMVIRRAADSLTLFNRGATIVIAVRAASFRSVRGLTCVAAVADEIAFWQAEDGSANPDDRNPSRGQADVADHPRPADRDFLALRPQGRAVDHLQAGLWRPRRSAHPGRPRRFPRDESNAAAGRHRSGNGQGPGGRPGRILRRVSDRHFGLCQPRSHRRLRCAWRLRAAAGRRCFVSRIRRSVGRR